MVPKLSKIFYHCLRVRGKSSQCLRVSAQRVSAQRASAHRVLANRVSADRVSVQRVSVQRVSAQRVSAHRVSAQIFSVSHKFSVLESCLRILSQTVSEFLPSVHYEQNITLEGFLATVQSLLLPPLKSLQIVYHLG